MDDEPSIRVALQRWFGARGFEVHEADNGQKAVAMSEERAYDIITMDLEMPEMGGAEAIRAIRKVRPKVPIIVLTGFMRETESALASGANRVLTKPLRLKELEDHIRELLTAKE